jgi:hypothetical protein
VAYLFVKSPRPVRGALLTASLRPGWRWPDASRQEPRETGESARHYFPSKCFCVTSGGSGSATKTDSRAQGPSRRHWSVNIRKFVLPTGHLDELVERGTFTAHAARFRDAAIVAGLSVVVAGGTQAGKTTTDT